MKKFFFKKRISICTASLLVAAAIIATLWATGAFSVQDKPDIDELYAIAVRDSMTVEPEEILPVISVSKNSDMVTWNDAGDRVLLLTWHKHPESYPEGRDVALTSGEVWTFTDREIKSWYKKNGEAEDMTLRLEQLIGLPPESGYTHMTALWADPADIVRPAYEPSITAMTLDDEFARSVDESFRTWFDENILNSYFYGAYPWTRLGYTYDWSGGGTEYGLSQFLIKEGASVSVEFTYTTEEFIEWLRS